MTGYVPVTLQLKIGGYMVEEIWKDIEGYEGLYQVSTQGRVHNIKNGKTRILFPSERRGYFSVSLSKDGKKKNMYVHRLVAIAFIANPDKLPEVNHKDETHTNNEVTNLEWSTNAYNNAYGTRNTRIGITKSKAVNQLKNGVVVKQWKSTREASRNGFQAGCISECCNGKRQKHQGYEWRYAT